MNPVGPNTAFYNIKMEFRKIGLGERGDWIQLIGYRQVTRSCGQVTNFQAALHAENFSTTY